VLFTFNKTKPILSEIMYIRGDVPVHKYDFGTSAERPTVVLQKNHRYFDSTLNKSIWYDGKIWRDDDKNSIVDMAMKCKLYDLCPNKITFNRVLRTMKQSLGYDIESGIQNIDDKHLTYKIVVSFDDEKINYSPPYTENNE
jgi:hypothetical protein